MDAEGLPLLKSAAVAAFFRLCNRQVTNFPLRFLARNRKNRYSLPIKQAPQALKSEDVFMILADKIISLRKKAGWSQEELAEQLGVTRQSVSKWEGAQSVPDMDKIVQMSRLFGVTTDFLLKDELSEEEPAPEDAGTALRRVTMAEASEYLALRRAAAPRIAFATMLCILSPICLILLGAMSEIPRFGISEDAAAGVGLCVLLVMVAVAVAIFLSCAARVKAYDFLEKEPFDTEYGVSGMVRERQREYAPAYTRLNITGTVLCILAAVPLFAAMCVSASDLFYVGAVCVLLAIVSVGCYAFVLGGVNHSAMQALLEEEDYTRENKAKSPIVGAVSGIYWLLVTAIFLFYTFGPMGNGQPKHSWFIWAVAGVLFGAVMLVVKLISRRK